MANQSNSSGDKRPPLNRTISFQNDLDCSTTESKSKTATPSLLSRLKSFKRDRGSVLKGSIHSENSASTAPMDDIIMLDSYEEVSLQEEISVTVCRDMIRQNLLDLMRSSGNIQVLQDIENGKINPDNAKEIFQNATDFEKNVAFLWSIFYKKQDLTSFFLLSDVDFNFYEPRLGFGALHLSGFSGCVNCAEFLISRGADVNVLLGNYTPLHCAAFGNCPQTAGIFLKAGAKAFSNESGSDRGCNETVLHSAVRAKAYDCIQLFIDENLDLNLTGSCGLTPLHLAADLGDSHSLEMLLDSGRCDINIHTSDRKNTALHLAAENGFVDCVEVLLRYGADPNRRNYRHQIALHLAAKTCLECVETLLRAGSDVNAQDGDNRTPLHSAVCKSELEFGLEIIMCLVSWKSDVNKKDKYGYTPLHIAALNELTDCVECLISNGADISARTRGGTSALSIISRKTPAALSAINQKLDECVTLKDPDASSKEVVLKFNFRYLLQNCQLGEISFLQTFVEEGQKGVLEHPLCEAFLYLKWQKIRKYYIARLVFGFIYVLTLSLYVLTALAYQCYNYSLIDEVSTRIGIIVDPNLCAKKSYFGDLLRQNPFVIEMEWFILVFITCLEICRKCYGFSGYKSFRHYITQLDNLVEWFVVFSVFLTSFIYTGKTYVWQNHIGALAVLCGWSNLMIMVGNLPVFGSYVTMYTKVQKEFTKLFLAYICLLIGFTVCFCVIFPESREFSNPFIAVIKILVMMTGELEFDSLLQDITKDKNGSVILMEISALAAFVSFVLFVTIILMNLLIGIAVHDIQGLQKTAGLSKLVGQTKLIAHIESALFNGCLPSIFLKLLQITALISPSAYRVVVCVKPLNPRETRLPKNVMRAALEISKQKKQKHPISAKNSVRRAATTLRRKNTDENMYNILIKLSEEVERLKEILLNNQNIRNSSIFDVKN